MYIAKVLSKLHKKQTTPMLVKPVTNNRNLSFLVFFIKTNTKTVLNNRVKIFATWYFQEG